MLNIAKPVEFSAEPDPSTSVLSFPLDVYSFLNKAKWENGSRVAIPINAHQNANQKPIESAPVY